MDYNGPPAAPGMCHVCNSIWMLSDFTAKNGATRVVFGKRQSRRWIEAHCDFLDAGNIADIMGGTAARVLDLNS